MHVGQQDGWESKCCLFSCIFYQEVEAIVKHETQLLLLSTGTTQSNKLTMVLVKYMVM